jgi:hypothetical protein
MIQKMLGYYTSSTKTSPFNRDNFYIEISNHHIACWVKDEKAQAVTAIEWFKIELEYNNWNDIFYELRKETHLLEKSYDNTYVFLANKEAVLIPAVKFNMHHATDYLKLLYGADYNKLVQQDKCNYRGEEIHIAYYINADLLQSIERNFLSIKYTHTYTGILHNLSNLELTNILGNNVVVYFYHHYFIIALFKNSQLQIIQQHHYTTQEDVLFWLLHYFNVYHLHASTDGINIAGYIDMEGEMAALIKNNFSNVYALAINNELIQFTTDTPYPDYYFTPFFSLEP